MAIHDHEPVPFNIRRPFSRAEARAAGITLKRLLGPQFHRVLFDRYVSVAMPITQQLIAQTALELAPAGSFISHHTAAEVWGGVVPPTPEVHVTVREPAARSRRRGIIAHFAADAPPPVNVAGLQVSSPVQTFLDLAAGGLALVDLVILGDSLVKARRVTPAELIEAAAAASSTRVRRARRAARLVRAGVDSPQETRLRLLIVLAGLPEPRVNHTVRHPDGSWRMRFDLSYPDLLLLIEYDGRQHAESSAQWRRDLARREELDAAGYRILVVTSDDLYAPESVLERVRGALIQRGATGVRRRFATEWRQHFRSR